MDKRSPEARRAARDKSVIDHLTTGAMKPDMAARGEREPRHFSKEKGRKLDKALHKEWTQDQGGLPEF